MVIYRLILAEKPANEPKESTIKPEESTIEPENPTIEPETRRTNPTRQDAAPIFGFLFCFNALRDDNFARLEIRVRSTGQWPTGETSISKGTQPRLDLRGGIR